MESDSDSDSDIDIKYTPPNDNTDVDNVTCSNLIIPVMSKAKYSAAYNTFLNWRKKQRITSFSENVLMAYFGKMSKKFKPTTLWAQYSMLRATLNINNNVDVATYFKLREFLKRKSLGYRPKKTKFFTSDEVHKFLNVATDDKHLLAKVILIMGIIGACGRDDLNNMKATDVKDLGSAVLVEVPKTNKTKLGRKFIISGRYYEIVKKYADLRPVNPIDPHFFLSYAKGKCAVQKIGINKFGNMGKQIAAYLKLPNPELYTGHCFRKSSIIQVDSGTAVPTVKTEDNWKSSTITKEYTDESSLDIPSASEIQSSLILPKIASTSTIFPTSTITTTFPTTTIVDSGVEKAPVKESEAWKSSKVTENNADESSADVPTTSNSTVEKFENMENLVIDTKCANSAKLIFNNCSNITINIIKDK